jgi:hypothetical protein
MTPDSFEPPDKRNFSLYSLSEKKPRFGTWIPQKRQRPIINRENGNQPHNNGLYRKPLPFGTLQAENM